MKRLILPVVVLAAALGLVAAAPSPHPSIAYQLSASPSPAHRGDGIVFAGTFPQEAFKQARQPQYPGNPALSFSCGNTQQLVFRTFLSGLFNKTSKNPDGSFNAVSAPITLDSPSDAPSWPADATGVTCAAYTGYWTQVKGVPTWNPVASTSFDVVDPVVPVSLRTASLVTTPAQTYKVGTSADDGWQSNVPPKSVKAITAPVGGSCTNKYDGSAYPVMVLSSGYRFENVQLDPGQIVNDVRLKLAFTNPNYSALGLTDFLSPIHVELSPDSNDFVYQPDIVNRNRAVGDLDWSAKPLDASIGNFGYTTSPNLAAQVQQVVNLPGWKRGNSITILITGEVYAPGTPLADEYAFAYGWEVFSWDCHTALPPTLVVS